MWGVNNTLTNSFIYICFKQNIVNIIMYFVIIISFNFD